MSFLDFQLSQLKFFFCITIYLSHILSQFKETIFLPLESLLNCVPSITLLCFCLQLLPVPQIHLIHFHTFKVVFCSGRLSSLEVSFPSHGCLSLSVDAPSLAFTGPRYALLPVLHDTVLFNILSLPFIRSFPFGISHHLFSET